MIVVSNMNILVIALLLAYGKLQVETGTIHVNESLEATSFHTSGVDATPVVLEDQDLLSLGDSYAFGIASNLPNDLINPTSSAYDIVTDVVEKLPTVSLEPTYSITPTSHDKLSLTGPSSDIVGGDADLGTNLLFSNDDLTPSMRLPLERVMETTFHDDDALLVTIDNTDGILLQTIASQAAYSTSGLQRTEPPRADKSIGKRFPLGAGKDKDGIKPTVKSVKTLVYPTKTEKVLQKTVLSPVGRELRPSYMVTESPTVSAHQSEYVESTEGILKRIAMVTSSPIVTGNDTPMPRFSTALVQTAEFESVPSSAISEIETKGIGIQGPLLATEVPDSSVSEKNMASTGIPTAVLLALNSNPTAIDHKQTSSDLLNTGNVLSTSLAVGINLNGTLTLETDHLKTSTGIQMRTTSEAEIITKTVTIPVKEQSSFSPLVSDRTTSKMALPDSEPAVLETTIPSNITMNSDAFSTAITPLSKLMDSSVLTSVATSIEMAELVLTLSSVTTSATTSPSLVATALTAADSEVVTTQAVFTTEPVANLSATAAYTTGVEHSIATTATPSLTTVQSDSIVISTPSLTTVQSDFIIISTPSPSTVQSDSIVISTPSLTTVQLDSIVISTPSLTTGQPDSIVILTPSLTTGQPDSIVILTPSLTTVQPDSIVILTPSLTTVQSDSIVISTPSLTTVQSDSIVISTPSLTTVQSDSIVITTPSFTTVQSDSIVISTPSLTTVQSDSIVISTSPLTTVQSDSIVISTPSLTTVQSDSIVISTPSLTRVQPDSIVILTPSLTTVQSDSIVISTPSLTTVQSDSIVILTPSPTTVPSDSIITSETGTLSTATITTAPPSPTTVIPTTEGTPTTSPPTTTPTITTTIDPLQVLQPTCTKNSTVIRCPIGCALLIHTVYYGVFHNHHCEPGHITIQSHLSIGEFWEDVRAICNGRRSCELFNDREDLSWAYWRRLGIFSHIHVIYECSHDSGSLEEESG